MPWATRGRKRYFYESVRIGGRATRLYRGHGPAAQEAADLVEARRRAREAEAEALRAEQQRHAEAAAPLDELCNLTHLLLRAALAEAGYHQHARGAWRRRRHVPTDPTPAEAPAGGDPDRHRARQRR